MSHLHVLGAGPAVTVQDRGRPGFLDRGLSQGGAADPLALAEGAALLGQSPDCAALELAGMGGRFRADRDLRIALTGAPMPAEIDGKPLVWSASHLLRAGAVLAIGAARTGSYGYLHLGGGIATPQVLGSRAAHLAAGLGQGLQPGDRLPLGSDAGADAGMGTGMRLLVEDRFSGGDIRILPGMQTPLFPAEVRARFETTEFRRGARANRMGMALESAGPGFAAAGQRSILSEVITPGDIQMTGDGRPFVLLPECQPTGGYPRIGTVIPADMAKVAQTPAGARLRFAFVTRAEAMAAQARHAAHLAALPTQVEPLLRDPHMMHDLLSYQLIGGVISATEEDVP
ncbi:5-oxoprolinase subunit C family protein [Pseudodonghicola flavimaris]|uniref:Biotin-dependent carboxyltransferase family protein n=1 Tax=Pseudodonghicola flavimaris TaxID=3050036 RepID=A0ABT7EW68_9RHOB|nr:biotin-dependent carboxyltransferase family protein [Pseudodonghicola flavimaris]MDK3016590.1 biotin-dependent carboxyltransferase family protein [Pseudodonghicola flavimaris]